MRPDELETPAALVERARHLYSGIRALSSEIHKLRPYICPFDRLLPLVPANASVLDVGCGGGLFLGLLADCGRISRGLGFDANASAIWLAQRMTKNLPACAVVEFRVIDATQDWPDGLYDVVSLIDVLHHVEPGSWKTIVARAISRVRPGGMLLYKDMATKPRWRAWCNQLHDLFLARQWIHYVPLNDVKTFAIERHMLAATEGAAACYWYAHEWVAFRRADA
jgi:2-polyprenyl-3-methyl-5-hydroxy-6-metoxy-1,4-benzoquinol methylase